MLLSVKWFLETSYKLAFNCKQLYYKYLNVITVQHLSGFYSKGQIIRLLWDSNQVQGKQAKLEIEIFYVKGAKSFRK